MCTVCVTVPLWRLTLDVLSWDEEDAGVPVAEPVGSEDDRCKNNGSDVLWTPGGAVYMFNTKELTDDQGSKVEQWIEISEYEQNRFKIINFRCFFITYTKIKHWRWSNRQVLIRGENSCHLESKKSRKVDYRWSPGWKLSCRLVQTLDSKQEKERTWTQSQCDKKVIYKSFKSLKWAENRRMMKRLLKTHHVQSARRNVLLLLPTETVHLIILRRDRKSTTKYKTLNPRSSSETSQTLIWPSELPVACLFVHRGEMLLGRLQSRAGLDDWIWLQDGRSESCSCQEDKSCI